MHIVTEDIPNVICCTCIMCVTVTKRLAPSTDDDEVANDLEPSDVEELSSAATKAGRGNSLLCNQSCYFLVNRSGWANRAGLVCLICL